MKKTYVDVLQALPPDETLHQFLASHGLAVPPALDAQPHEPPNRAVIEAIMTWGDKLCIVLSVNSVLPVACWAGSVGA